MNEIIIWVLVMIAIVGALFFGAYLGRVEERERQKEAELMARIDRLEKKVFGDEESEENEEKAE